MHPNFANAKLEDSNYSPKLLIVRYFVLIVNPDESNREGRIESAEQRSPNCKKDSAKFADLFKRLTLGGGQVPNAGWGMVPELMLRQAKLGQVKLGLLS